MAASIVTRDAARRTNRPLPPTRRPLPVSVDIDLVGVDIARVLGVDDVFARGDSRNQPSPENRSS